MDGRNVLVNGQTRRIDLGCINGRYFLLMVGIGFDGEVTQAVEGKPLKRLGILGTPWLFYGSDLDIAAFQLLRKSTNIL